MSSGNYCGRTLKSRNKRRVLGEEEAGGDEKTARVGDVEASKAGDSRRLSEGKSCTFFCKEKETIVKVLNPFTYPSPEVGVRHLAGCFI